MAYIIFDFWHFHTASAVDQVDRAKINMFIIQIKSVTEMNDRINNLCVCLVLPITIYRRV